MIAAHVANLFMGHGLISYGMPAYLLTDNGVQLVNTYFAIACSLLRIRHSTTTAYHLQTNIQANRFNESVPIHLRHYVAEHQIDLDTFEQPLTYAYNPQIFSSSKQTPFRLVLGQHLSGHTLLETGSALSTNVKAETSLQIMRLRLKAFIRSLQDKGDINVATVQQLHKQDYDLQIRVAT